MSRNLTIAGTLFFLIAAVFMISLMTMEGMVPGYDVGENAISDLGVFPETATLFTIVMVVLGALNIAGGYFFYLQHERKGTLVLFVLAGVGTIGVGLVSLESPLGIHGLFALIAFAFFNAQAIASSRMAVGVMRIISLIAGIVGLVFLVAMFLGDAGVEDVFFLFGHGGTERMIAFPVMLWMAAFGGYIMSSRPELEKKGA